MPSRPRPRLSLKARALGWLAQREHSRAELRRKLLRVARQEAALQADESGARGSPKDVPPALHAAPLLATDAAPDAVHPEQQVDTLLDWLQAHRYLSETRFVESRVHARAARYGNLRIRQELAQHGVAADADTLQRLRDSELERAREVWRRKFDQPPADAHERARQMRFLVQRGFSADVVRRVVQGADDE
jgi:regulatory protein